MPKNYEISHSPSPADYFKDLINEKFINHEPSKDTNAREYEEELIIKPKQRLSLCPWATEATLKRPIIGQEDNASSKWKTFGGHRLTITEAAGTMQTDFYIRNNDIWYRQIILNPYEYSLLHQKKSSKIDHPNIKNNIINNIYLGPDLSISLNFKNRKNSFGEQLTTKQTQELFKWIKKAEALQ